MNATLFGNMVFAVVINLRYGHTMLGWVLNLMVCVLMRRKGHMPFSEIGIIQLQAQGHQGSLATTRSYKEARKDSPLESSERESLC